MISISTSLQNFKEAISINHKDTHRRSTTPPRSMASNTSTLQPEAPVEMAQMGIDTSNVVTVHGETHSDHSDIIKDIILGFADGLTVPFALTAGLSSLGSTRLVIIGGLAELFSGCISMGLGAYLAAVTDRDHYIAEEKRERKEVADKPDDERKEIYEIMGKYGCDEIVTKPLVDCLEKDTNQWVQFMMDFELKLNKPKLSRAWISGLTMGCSYFIGGLIPMIPYFIVKNVAHALFISIGITVVILLVFGFVKNYVVIKTKRAGFFGAIQTLFIGVIAAATSYGIVRALDSKEPVTAGQSTSKLLRF